MRKGDRGDGDRGLRKAEGGMALENEVAMAALVRAEEKRREEKRRRKHCELLALRRWEEPI